MRQRGTSRRFAAGAAVALVATALTVLGPAAGATPSSSIYFARRAPGDGQYDLYRIQPDGTQLTRLTDTPSINEGYPRVSPDGSKIAFTANGHIYVAPVSNLNARTDLVAGHDPSWAPDSSRLAYAGNTEAPAIFVIDADGSDARQVTPFDGRPRGEPDWSFEGVYLIYSVYLPLPAQGPSTISIRKADGSDAERWARGGVRPAFIRAAGSPLKVIYNTNAFIDGRLYWDVYSATLTENGEDRKLTTGADGTAFKLRPAASADGTQVVYESQVTEGASSNLNVVSSLGGSMTRILSGGNNIQASWSAYQVPPPPTDTTGPTSSATRSGASGTFGIHDGAVSIDVTAADEPGGSGVASIHWSASGAQPHPATTVAGSTASISVSAMGTTTVTYWAVDVAGNVGEPHDEVVRIDDRPVVSVSPESTGLEPDTGATGGLYLQITLSKPSPDPTVVSYYTRDGSATGCLSGACDYWQTGTVAQPRQVTIPGGTTTMAVALNVNPDGLIEGEETFDVVLSEVSANAVLGRASGVGRIVDVDSLSQGGKPIVILTPKTSIIEGDASGAKAQVLISLSQRLADPVTVTFETADLDAIGAAVCGPGTDYRAIAPRSLTVPAGALARTIDIAVCSDTVDGGNRSFAVSHDPVVAPPGSDLIDVRAAAIVDIIDDDIG